MLRNPSLSSKMTPICVPQEIYATHPISNGRRRIG